MRSHLQARFEVSLAKWQQQQQQPTAHSPISHCWPEEGCSRWSQSFVSLGRQPNPPVSIIFACPAVAAATNAGVAAAAAAAASMANDRREH